MGKNKQNCAGHGAESAVSVWFGGLVVVVAILIAYANSFSGSLIFDDLVTVSENPSIRQLWPITVPLQPPSIGTTGGRPLANLTFAINYAMSGSHPAGYHFVNLLIHVLAALALYGIVRRTLLLESLRERFGRDAVTLAAVVALLWGAHPLMTQSVTYISQRTEALMGLCYLGALYCFIRGVEGRTGLWHALSVVFCLMGALSKETIATVPILVLLYDRTFFSGGFGKAFCLRWKTYLALAGTWVVLGILMFDVGRRGVGFSYDVSWVHYAYTQCKAVVLYAALSLWPHPLSIDRGPLFIRTLAEAAPWGILLLAMLSCGVWALARRPVVGFACAWFFVILAPTSSVIPVALQPIAENRVYLPAVAIVASVVLVAYRFLGRTRTLLICGVLGVGAVAATLSRNADFASATAIWSDAVAKFPSNPRAHYNLGVALGQEKERRSEAEICYRKALELDPEYGEAWNNLGEMFLRAGRYGEAMPYLEKAVRLRPKNVDVLFNMGVALDRVGRGAESVEYYEKVIRLAPGHSEAQANLGKVFVEERRFEEALLLFERAVKTKPDSAIAQYNLGTLRLSLGNPGKALEHLKAALVGHPEPMKVEMNYASACYALGRKAEAIDHFSKAVNMRPDFVEARLNLAYVLAEEGKSAEAIEQYEKVLQYRPNHAGARRALEGLRK